MRTMRWRVRALCTYAPHRWCARSFYSGLDATKEYRLKQSGFTFNKPRGRGTLSRAFESCIRLVPMADAGVGALYAPVQEPRRNEQQQSWRVLVVNTVSLASVEEPIAYPSAAPHFYHDWASRSEDDKVVERFVPASLLDIDLRNNYHYARLNHRARSHLRQNGDTTLMQRSYTYSRGFGDTQQLKTDLPTEFFLALCVDPHLSDPRYRREEAQVELITGYRNILFEAADLRFQSNKASKNMDCQHVADVIRIPALSIYNCGASLHGDMGKLSQQALIKGFHRLSTAAQEALLHSKQLRVELYVPQPMLGQFEQAFVEDAWDTPQSVFSPGRVALYPGLAPPRTLLPYDGWVGKRPELVEAIETDGRSLKQGPHYSLDGKAIEHVEVMSQMRVFGRHEAEQQRLESERGTAAKALGLTADELEQRQRAAISRPLHAGLGNGESNSSLP